MGRLRRLAEEAGRERAARRHEGGWVCVRLVNSSDLLFIFVIHVN